jgi:hypothetical protein
MVSLFKGPEITGCHPRPACNFIPINQPPNLLYRHGSRELKGKSL